jgi:hypothetical protein
MAEALTFQHRRLLGTPQAAVRVRIAAELIRHAERAGDHGLQLAYRVAHAADLVELGRFDEWEASATEHARLAERLKSPEDSALAHRNRAMRLLMQGRFSEARAFAQRGAVVAQHCEPRVLLELGQVAVAIEAETVGVSASLLNRFQLGGTGWESPRLWVLCQMDRADLAREGLPSVLDRLRLRPRSSSWHASAAILADVIVHLDDTESATEVLEWLRGFESLHAAGGVGGVYMGPVRRSIGRLQGIVGCCDDAVDSLEQGLRDMQALGAVPWVSRIHLDLAECYARRRKLGDRDRAAAHAHTGTRLAKQYGMADLERRGRQLLAAVPARLGRVAD